MYFPSQARLPYLLGALLLVAAPVAEAQRGRGGESSSGRSRSDQRGGQSQSSRSNSGSSNRSYAAPNPNYGGSGRSYAAPSRQYYNGGRNYYAAPRYRYAPRVYGGGYYSGRYYSGRGYFYGGSFWARPYFGVGIGIPFGFGYPTNRGCGYVDETGAFYPAPCYAGNANSNTPGYDPGYNQAPGYGQNQDPDSDRNRDQIMFLKRSPAISQMARWHRQWWISTSGLVFEWP